MVKKNENLEAGSDELGKLLKQLRKDKNLTLIQLSKISGVSNPYISQIENGKFIPSPEMLRKLANFFQVSYIDLLIVAGYVTKEELAVYFGNEVN